ncbi:phosphorylated adapter RNA export protein [Ixodes scapularis]|nr:phosphorylated adapter RNA export protein [Ixodes scapularis]
MEAPLAKSAPAYRQQSSSSSEDDSDDDETSWKRQATDKTKSMLTDNAYNFSDCPSAVQPQQSFNFGRKRVNNVWGAVLNEQLLSENMGQFSVVPNKWGHDRECESYDFTRKALDTRPDPDEPDDLFDDVGHIDDPVDIQAPKKSWRDHVKGTKRSIRDRLGERSSGRPSRSRSPKFGRGNRTARSKSGGSKPLSPSAMEEDETVVAEMAADMAERLQEPKKDLLERVVSILGTSESRKLLTMTEDIEAAGGIMTRDKSRRRTPGGVFFYLLKAHTPRDQMLLIFEEEMREQELYRRRIKKERNKRLLERHANQTAAFKEESEMAQRAADAEVDVDADAEAAAEAAEEAAEVDLEDGEIVD